MAQALYKSELERAESLSDLLAQRDDEILELKNGIEQKNAKIAQLEKENKEWEDRYNQLLSDYEDLKMDYDELKIEHEKLYEKFDSEFKPEFEHDN